MNTTIAPEEAVLFSSTDGSRRQTANVIPMPTSYSPPPVVPATEPNKEAKKAGRGQKKAAPRPGELYPEIPTKTVPTLSAFQRLSPTALYVYRAAQDDVICGVLDCPSGRTTVIYGKKDGHASWYPVDDAMLNKHLPNRPLYHLEAVARATTLPVVVACSEVAADTLQNELRGMIVVSIMPGAESKTDWAHLRGRTVTVWPDTGANGLKLARDIARRIDDDQPADSASPLVKVALLPDALPEDWKLGQQPAEGGNVNYQAIVDAAVVAAEITDANGDEGVKYPKNYVMTPAGLVYLIPATSSREFASDTEIEVTTRPFDVISAVDTRSAADAGLLLRWKNDQGHVREFVAPKGEISNIKSDLFSRMAKLGFGFNPAQAQHLRTFFMKIYCNSFTRIVDKVGWSESSKGVFDTFIVPGGDVLSSGDERIIFKNDNVDMEALKALHAPAGSLPDWQDSIAAYARGNSRLTFAISAALASPLLPLLKAPGGGFHFYGRSSRGKTTMLTVGASVWGDTNDPVNTIIKKWKSTANSMEGLLERVSETCAFLDEATNAPGRTIGEIVYMASDGEGKNRATREVGLRKGKTFRLIFVSSGEKSLSDQIAADSGAIQGGQDARMPSIHALVSETNGAFDDIHSFDDPASFSKYLTGKCKECHGVAGRHFIKELMHEIKDKGQEYVVDLINGQIAQFREKYVRPGIDGQVERVADRFALVAAAGEMAIWLGVLPWEEGEAMTEIGRVYEDWIDSRGGDGSREDINLIKALREFLMRHGLRRFDSLRRIETASGGGHEGTADDFVSNVTDRVGFREQVSANNNEAIFYDYVIPAVTWDSFIRDDLKATSMTGIDAAKAIRDAGFLKVGSRGMTVKRTLPTVGKQVRCYTILHTIMKDDNEEAQD